MNRTMILRILSCRHAYFVKLKNKSCITINRSIKHSCAFKEENKKDTAVEEKLNKPVTEDGTYVWVGPPHPVSNLRLKVFPSSKDFTSEETHFYEKSKEIQDWTQQYWESHNKDFEESKKVYIQKISNDKSESEFYKLSTEEMAEFYRDFLNKNYHKYMAYNWQWYKRNFELLYLSAKAEVSRIRRMVKKR